jgi:multidrug efflux pump subunit AcrB
MGANYTLVTVVGFGIILALVIILNRYTRKNIDQEEMFCTISLNKKINLEELLNMLKKHSNYLFLRDFDITDRFSQIGVIVNFKSSKEINSLSKELNRKYSGVNIKYLNKRALS